MAALLLSLVAHGLLLSPRREPSAPQGKAAPSVRPSLQTRSLSEPRPGLPTPLRNAPKAPALARAHEAGTAVLSPKRVAEPAASGPPEPQAHRPPAAVQAELLAPAAQVASPVEWRFLLLQDGRQGLARLSWLPQPDTRYQLRLDRQLEGRPLPGWRSEGKLGPQGLLPERFAQMRRGKDAQATNFRRPEGLISFSANADVFELPEGVQDRLSWWFQLAALLDAAPDRYKAGETLHMTVVGLRGEARDWSFEIMGPALLDLPDRAALPTLHLHRPAIFAYSGEIDVWLDPQRRHLPVRLVYRLPDERSWELVLLDDGLAP